ncbi:hypothetical protein AC579_1008 [Pseudocercospora musae]|uniref:Uncharacterized protein n=1 Tax=Pseudocercospora musae TaxID=113226 RepID=A0A139IBB7_9PEZI|nr:hypothetical protein AC579_1008 [Pseudocercospora musae]
MESRREMTMMRSVEYFTFADMASPKVAPSQDASVGKPIGAGTPPASEHELCYNYVPRNMLDSGRGKASKSSEINVRPKNGNWESGRGRKGLRQCRRHATTARYCDTCAITDQSTANDNGSLSALARIT